jgi:hypothetical protein
MLHSVAASFLGPGGPYLYLRLVTAAYTVSAIGRVIPVKRKQVPGYRRRMPAAIWSRGQARHRARPGRRAQPYRKAAARARVHS